MNKYFSFSATALTISLIVFSLFAAKSTSNLIYLHEQKKTVRSNNEHLKNCSSQGNVILDFYADWCNPCKRMSPLIDHAANALPNYLFIKINRDFFIDLANSFNITSIPTLIFLQNGKEIGRYDGKPLTKKELKKLIITTYSK